MLQPTSCGPGPPDKIFKFKQNLNETKENLKKQKRVKQKIKEFTIKQQQKEQQLYSNNNYNNEESRKEINKKHNDVNCMGNVVNANDVCEESIKNVKNLQKKNSNNDNNKNNNYNCHLKNIKKLYANQIKATKLAPTLATTSLKTTLTTTAVTENNSALLYSNSNEATTVATTITATSKVASATTAALTLVAIEDKDKLKLKKKEDKIPTISSKFEIFSVTVANVANNLNKFYKKFITKNAATVTVTTASTSSTSSSSTSTSIKWFLMFLMLFNILAQTPHQVAAEKSKHYYMQSLCKNHFLQQLYRKIDGAVLWSQNERNLDCIITFQTHSILQRFMLRFDMLQLDCNDHLYVYDGAHAVATPKIDISCRQTKQTVSSILTRTNFVTLKYVTDNWGTDANGFKLVITSVKDPKHTCKDFTCGSNGFCIHPDLLCDGINHCSDNSDESVHNLCQSETTSTVFGMDMTWFVMIVVSILLIISAAIVGITICVCRRQEETNNQQNTAIQLHHNLAETNGSSKHLHYTHGGTLTREHTQLPPTSGNWHHPAGPYTGYHRMQRNYLKMATKVRPILCLANFVN